MTTTRLVGSEHGLGRLRNCIASLVAGFALFVVNFANADNTEPYAPLGHPLVIEQVTGLPIYYTVGHPGVPDQQNEGHTSNAGFVVTRDGVLVFDALGTPSLGWALLQEIRKRTEKPVRYNVVSHYHADHIYGLQAFRDHTDAIIIAQDRARDYNEANEETADERSNQRLDQRRQALAPWVNKDTRIVPPEITFKNRLTLSLGDKHFQMIYAGPAHSADDIMMVVDDVLFAGDIVQNGRIPFMNSDDVDSQQWLAALSEVESLQPKFIIPGHGRPSKATKEAIAFTRDYIQFLRTAMAAAVQNWTEFNTAYRQTDWSKYEKMPAFEATNRGNAYRIYIELEKREFNAPKP